MTDAQNENINEGNNPESNMEEMHTEDRSEQASASKTTRRKRGSLAFVFVLIILGGGAAAGWYSQSMWLPQAQAWLDGLWSSSEGPDLLAAPQVDKAYLGKSTATSTYVLSAIPDEQPQTPLAAEDDIVAHSGDSAEADTNHEMPGVESQVEAVVADAAPVTDPQAQPADNAAQTATLDNMTTAMKPAGDSAGTTMSDMPVDAVTEVQSSGGAVTLQQARQAYWSRNLVMAEDFYRQVLADNSTSADAWGELGNVYYMQAKWMQAAEAYAEAAIRLLKKGDYSQAMYMRYIIRGLDPRQAARVDEQLQRMQAPARG